ncbi:MAG: Imm27 family immunity protein [Acidobacteriota bacterium]
MKSLGSDEERLEGQWLYDETERKVYSDEVCERIRYLVEQELERLASSPESGDWEILYRDPRDGRYWELTYPKSHMQGGGPQALYLLPAERASVKYQVDL